MRVLLEKLVLLGTSGSIYIALPQSHLTQFSHNFRRKTQSLVASLSNTSNNHKAMISSLHSRGCLLSLCLVACAAELQRFKQAPKPDGSLSFLVVGDWGRRGQYNQSQVALQVRSTYVSFHLNFPLLPSLCILHLNVCMLLHAYDVVNFIDLS